ncbi:hypothetical protein SE17_33445, partial [Kouleothrix aurantiaca]
MTSPFVPNYSPPINYEFALAPAHSALVSLALLTADMDVQDDEEWVSVTAAALSPEQAQRNRLAFGPFGAALTPARDFPDFPAYLAALDDTPPETLRARIPEGALALASDIDDAVVAHRLMGEWQPGAAFYAELLGEETSDADTSRPYPFCLAHPLEAAPDTLGDPAEWQVEWKWDGIRSQIIRRAGQSFIWSRGEELVTDRYPEL